MNKAYRKTIWLLTWTNFLTVEIQSFPDCSMIFEIHIYHNTGQSWLSCLKLVLFGTVGCCTRWTDWKQLHQLQLRHDVHVFPVRFFLYGLSSLQINVCVCMESPVYLFVVNCIVLYLKSNLINILNNCLTTHLKKVKMIETRQQTLDSNLFHCLCLHFHPHWREQKDLLAHPCLYSSLCMV